MTDLTVELLKSEAKAFAEIESNHAEPALYGVTDGKAVGTYFEHKFQACLHGKHGVAAARQDGVGEGVRCEPPRVYRRLIGLSVSSSGGV